MDTNSYVNIPVLGRQPPRTRNDFNIPATEDWEDSGNDSKPQLRSFLCMSSRIILRSVLSSLVQRTVIAVLKTVLVKNYCLLGVLAVVISVDEDSFSKLETNERPGGSDFTNPINITLLYRGNSKEEQDCRNRVS